MTDPVHHRLALAILKVTHGDELGTSIWERWIVAEREEAAEAVRPLLPILENTILDLKREITLRRDITAEEAWKRKHGLPL